MYPALELLQITAIEITDCKNLPIKYQFVTYYEGVAHSKNRIDIVKKLVDRLGAGYSVEHLHVRESLDAKWFYRWTLAGSNSNISGLHIYLTTDEQCTYCSLAFPTTAI